MAPITQYTFDFLNDLTANNNRDWFTENKPRYEKSHKEMYIFAESIIEELNKFDSISTATGKKSLYRIYRDVRFSKNKDPYKTNRSGSFAREGADRRGGYFFSVSPGETIIGGGFYQPNTDDLNLIRKQIELDANPLRQVLADQKFKKYYHQLLGEQLKTAPRGFDKEDPNIDLLRYKSFYVMHKFIDQEVLADDFKRKVIEGYKILQDFFDVMTSYLTTDLNGESTI
ncbi:DUF2461 domain-containing protein [Vicingaceae bacterium]|nr:DUF2461 domain-containing protein [Vicingaceae bacterium]MDB4061843.1 DUF2461 domain-containing protein [Vicingaceae bacterium]MDC1451677.1 DUF2461 domain-containing protein [Vicingaceae bacterium]